MLLLPCPDFVRWRRTALENFRRNYAAIWLMRCDATSDFAMQYIGVLRPRAQPSLKAT